MSKFHLNPTTGNPGKCSAEAGKCPFGDASQHYETQEEALKAFEQKMAGELGGSLQGSTKLSPQEKKYRLAKEVGSDYVNALRTHVALIDAKMKAPAGSPERRELNAKVKAAKAAKEESLENLKRAGFKPKEVVNGVLESGELFTRSEITRVRLQDEGTLSYVAGFPLEADSPRAMPGDEWIEKKNEIWDRELEKVKELPAGSKERANAAKSLMKRVIRETPMKRAIETLADKADLTMPETQRLVYSTPGVYEVRQMMSKAKLPDDEKAIPVFQLRALKNSGDYIEKVKALS